MGKSVPNQDEIWAKEYLIHCGFKPEAIAFEPDGIETPDFLLVEELIAVEVRRLNQHWDSHFDGPEAFEVFDVPFLSHFKKVLAEFGAPVADSWYVCPKFERPQLTKTWKPLLCEKLRPYHSGEVQDDDSVVCIDNHFSIRLHRRPKPANSAFQLSRPTDLNRDPWVSNVLEDNIKICIADKRTQRTTFKGKYPTSWLILVDHIMCGKPAWEGPPQILHDWDRVIVIWPGNYSRAYDVPGKAI